MRDKGNLGRSMVETLGVLAIIGVLSIAAIAGYTMAMIFLRSNTIVNEVCKMAVIGKAEKINGGALNLTEFRDDSGAISINGFWGVEAFDNGDGSFSLIVSNVEQKICQRIQQMGIPDATEILFNEDDACHEGENNSIEFIFDALMGQDGNCGYCQHIEDGSCVPNITCDNGCPGFSPVEDDSGKCLPCDSKYWFNSSEEECSKCSNRTYRNGRCIPNCDVIDQNDSLSPCMEIISYGEYCETNLRFLPEGTFCEQGGISGVCNARGQCIPVGESCSSRGSCPSGYFCNYGGTYGNYGGGYTANICQKVSPQTKEVNGTTYYYPSQSDMRSWCRPADNKTTCTWGYLAYPGAQDWCASIGRELITCSEYVNIRGAFFWTSYAGTWGQGGACRDDGSVWSGRPDGYAWTGGVICK